MSPTIERLEQQIGRRLKRGDILVNINRDDILFLREVVNPFIPGFKHFKDKKYPGVETRILTSHGPILETETFDRKLDVWESIIKEEDRTDHRFPKPKEK